MKKIYLIISLLLSQIGAVTICADYPMASEVHYNAAAGNWDFLNPDILMHLSEDQLTALLVPAIHQNNIEAVEKLIDMGAQVNNPVCSVITGVMTTPLGEACFCYIFSRIDNIPLIQLLLAKGADPYYSEFYPHGGSAIINSLHGIFDPLKHFFTTTKQRAQELLNVIEPQAVVSVVEPTVSVSVAPIAPVEPKSIVVKVSANIADTINLHTIMFDPTDEEALTLSTYQELLDEGKQFVVVITWLGEKWHANLFEKDSFNDCVTQDKFIDPINRQDIIYVFDAVMD